MLLGRSLRRLKATGRAASKYSLPSFAENLLRWLLQLALCTYLDICDWFTDAVQCRYVRRVRRTTRDDGNSFQEVGRRIQVHHGRQNQIKCLEPNKSLTCYLFRYVQWVCDIDIALGMPSLQFTCIKYSSVVLNAWS